MTRLARASALDAKLQWRQGIYFVALALTVISAAIVSALPPEAWRLLAALLITNMQFSTVFLVAAIVLLEKGQGVLEGLMVTPLTARDYLLAKVFSLGSIAVLENLALAALGRAYGIFEGLDWGLLIVGLVMSAIMFTLLGLCAVMRYDTLNQALIPLSLFWAVLELPLLTAFGVPETPLFYLIPTHGLWVIIQTAAGDGSAWLLLYGFGYPLLWIGGSFWLARRMVRGFVLRRIGG